MSKDSGCYPGSPLYRKREKERERTPGSPIAEEEGTLAVVEGVLNVEGGEGKIH